MPRIFKSLSPSDSSIVPFPAYYQYSYTYQSGSVSNSDDVTFSYASQFQTSSGNIRTPNFSQELYDSIIQTFYSSIPRAAYGISSMSYSPSGSAYVISVTQNLFGEKIAPGSFNIKVASTQSYDDGNGNLIVSSSGVGRIVGTIFYDKGIALFKPTASATATLNNGGLYVTNGTTVEINFSSSVSFYEKSYRIRLNPTDFLYSLNNPSITTNFSGSNKNALQLIASQSILPYVTTIGLYNEQNELLLVAKPSVPIQRTSDVIQTFIVKFDI